MDGIAHYEQTIKLVNDLQEHFVELTFMPAESAVSS
jgi:hypothetical protein